MKSQPTVSDTVKLVAAHLSNGSDFDTREHMLRVLLDLVGPVDVANDLATLGALAPLLEQLQAGDVRVRALAAHVLGAAAANNPLFGAQVAQAGGVELLLARLRADEPEPRAKALYALSALARAAGPACEAFLNAHGAHTLRALLTTPTETHLLRRKALVLLTDLLATRQADDVLGGELQAVAEAVVSLLRGGGGSAAHTHSLDEDDAAEKALRGVRQLIISQPSLSVAALEAAGAQPPMAAMRERLQARAAGEEDGEYVRELLTLLDEVQQLSEGHLAARDTTEL